MSKVTLDLSAPEYEALQKMAKAAKRTPKAQAEWMLVDQLNLDPIGLYVRKEESGSSLEEEERAARIRFIGAAGRGHDQNA